MAAGQFSSCSSSRGNTTPGDQSNEYYLLGWYGSWNYRARHSNPSVGALISSLAVQAAQNSHIGYDRNSRETFWAQVQKVGYKPASIQVDCNADCSSSTACIVKCAGHLLNDAKLQNCPSGMTTYTEEADLRAAGFQVSSGTFSSSDGAQPGDIYWTMAHSVIWTSGSPDDGGLSASGGMYAVDFYTVTNTRNDAIIREVSYLDQKLKPSIQETDLRFSVLNYTVFVGGVWRAFANKYGYNVVSPMEPGADDFSSAGGLVQNPSSFGNVAPADPNSVARAIIQQTMKHGWCYAAAIGLAANIKQESEFNPGALGDYQGGVPTSFGLCQWHSGRGTNMKNYVGANWATNVTGQVDFIFYEPSIPGYDYLYNDALSVMQTVSNTLQGALQAANTWCVKWEQPRDKELRSQERQKYAMSLWPTYIQLKG